MNEPSDEDRLVHWLQANLGGDVVSLTRQARWRPAWWVELQRAGETLELYVRGERTDMIPIFPLEHELHMQEVLERHEIGRAHV